MRNLYNHNILYMKYYVMPEGDYRPWVICDSLEEARKERVKLAFRFISREVVIRDENLNLVQLF